MTAPSLPGVSYLSVALDLTSTVSTRAVAPSLGLNSDLGGHVETMSTH